MALKYKHLEGLDFDMEKQNCYTILRQFYKDNFDVELTDYACPTNWWESDLDLYMRLASTEGFEVVNSHQRDWRPGDVIVMAIDSRSGSGNHCAILLDNGDILQHLVGQRSCVTPYGGMFRNTTVGVFRHRGIPLQTPEETQVDVRDVLPPHLRARYAEIFGELAAAGDTDGGA